MTSEAPESTSPITITETEHTVRSSASEPTITDRTVESAQEQAVVENLMDKQAYMIETSFMAAMDRFSSELRTLFQERMPASTTPPGAGQRGQESEGFEPYGESSSHGASARTQASSYDQHLQPPTNGWGQSQPAWVNSGSSRPAKQPHAFHGPARRPSSHLGRSHTSGASNTPAASSQQYGHLCRRRHFPWILTSTTVRPA
ncbi:unnamed protein product [Prunus brigantina]